MTFAPGCQAEATGLDDIAAVCQERGIDIEMGDDQRVRCLGVRLTVIGRSSHPGLLDLARRMPTQELAHYVERGRKGVMRNRSALQAIERRLAMRDRETSVDALAMQQKAQRELQQYRTL